MKLLWLCALVVLTTTALGQSASDPDRKFWVSLGLGGYGAHQNSGFAAYLSANMFDKNQYWKVRYLHADEFSILGPNPQERYDELGVMYGLVSKPSTLRFSLSGGVGMFGGTNRVHSTDPTLPEWTGNHFFTFGVPLEAEVSWIPTHHFALGFSAFADLNPESSLKGLALKIEFGKIR